MGPNPLDAPQAIAAVASVGAVGPPAESAQPPGPPPPPPPTPVYSTTQQPADAPPSVDRFPRGRHRPQWAGLAWLAGGGAEGIDLSPSARRVLHAQQMLHGSRAAGPLLITPPPGELPPASSYPFAARGPTDRSASVPEPRAPRSDSGLSVQQPSPYSAAQRSKQRSGGAGSSGWPVEMQLA